MAERLAALPTRAVAPAPSFNYAQAMVCDTSRIRNELGYADIVDEGEAMVELALTP
jgi:hypothetical protein